MGFKMEDIQKANALLDSIRSLKYQINFVTAGHGLGITIQSTYQNEAFVDAIRPHLVKYMEGELEKLYQRLKDLGVDVGDPATEESDVDGEEEEE
jgi:hypothetical protein